MALAEWQLRVWYQCFLGIRPKGYLVFNYKNRKYDIHLDGIDAKLQLILPEGGASRSDIIPFCNPDDSIIQTLR